ncbi:MAG: hypothetical protein NWF01_11660 [Candidatus Bathyarchaeota archaeon]|nr:hypothetical protein [Candidatus Bathyarchaeota archaeon]
MKREIFGKTNQTGRTQNIGSMVKTGGRQFLIKLKQKAIRSNNSWFKVLSLEKRRFIEAVIQTVDRIQSSLLLKLMTELSEKLLCAIGGLPAFIGKIRSGMISYGFPLAQKISSIAHVWGNKLSHKWANDEGFVRYLTVTEVNNLPMYQASRKLAVTV